MSKFRKKPVVIEAVRWTENLTFSDVTPWLTQAIQKNPGEPGAAIRVADRIHVFTLEGTMEASPGDWIIRGVKGEMYPCKPDIFEATYEQVSG